jgi:parvulin-like peptidyl-prolyl isomerase
LRGNVMAQIKGQSQGTGPAAPERGLDKFRLREIEQVLASDLQGSSERLRIVATEEQKQQALQSHLRALQRFTDFAARHIVPEDLMAAGEATDNGSRKV